MASMKCPSCGEVCQNVTIADNCVYCGGRLDLVHFERIYTPGGVDFRAVARYQRWLVRIFPFVVGATILWFFPPAPLVSRVNPRVILLAAVLLALVSEVLLLHALNCTIETVSLYVILTFIPCLNLFVLFLTNTRAIEQLNAAGIQVGILGASDIAARTAMEANLCKHCGYNLTGNTSGICPECGTSTYASRGHSTTRDRKKRTTCGRCGHDLSQTANGNCPVCDPTIV